MKTGNIVLVVILSILLLYAVYWYVTKSNEQSINGIRGFYIVSKQVAKNPVNNGGNNLPNSGQS